jgi:hypothetical protein
MAQTVHSLMWQKAHLQHLGSSRPNGSNQMLHRHAAPPTIVPLSIPPLAPFWPGIMPPSVPDPNPHRLSRSGGTVTRSSVSRK